MTSDTKTYAHDQAHLVEMAAALKKGGVVILPTDTVYDLACSIKHPEAIQRIFTIKERPTDQSLPMVISRPEVALEIAEFRDKDLEVLRKIWPAPWTLIQKARASLAPGLKSPFDGTVALRCPDYAPALEILRRAGDTLAVSSANYTGGSSPVRFDAIPEDILGSVDQAMDAGPCPLGGETAIARLEGRRVRIIRSGCVSPEEVARVENLLVQMLLS
jgi:L-threonylcarbamoyladenylate synthase